MHHEAGRCPEPRDSSSPLDGPGTVRLARTALNGVPLLRGNASPRIYRASMGARRAPGRRPCDARRMTLDGACGKAPELSRRP